VYIRRKGREGEMKEWEEGVFIPFPLFISTLVPKEGGLIIVVIYHNNNKVRLVLALSPRGLFWKIGLGAYIHTGGAHTHTHTHTYISPLHIFFG
jgi:hypothetical protein